MPNMRFLEKGCRSPKWLATEMPIGSIIIAVAVLDIHMDKKPVAIIKPKMTFFSLVPTTLIILKAIRLCNPDRSMAKPTTKPPINKKM